VEDVEVAPEEAPTESPTVENAADTSLYDEREMQMSDEERECYNNYINMRLDDYLPTWVR